MAGKQRETDWSQVEADYRAGVKSLRQIASEHGITEGAIRKRAKKEDWARDLAAKIRAQADALVRKDAVRAKVRNETCVPEKVVVEANAEVQASVMREHRAGLTKARELVHKLLTELEQVTDSRELLNDLAEIMAGADDGAHAKRVEAMTRVIALSGRASNVKTLVESLTKLVAVEREVFGIRPPETTGGSSLVDLLSQLQ